MSQYIWFQHFVGRQKEIKSEKMKNLVYKWFSASIFDILRWVDFPLKLNFSTELNLNRIDIILYRIA